MQVMIFKLDQTDTQLRISVADTWPLRFRGLLRRPKPAVREGLMITRCRAVHTIGMSYPIDIVFVDKEFRVVGISHAIQPGRWKIASPRRARAAHVIELRHGEAQMLGLRPGSHLRPSAHADFCFWVYRTSRNSHTKHDWFHRGKRWLLLMLFGT